MLGAASTLRSTPPRRAVIALALWVATAAAAPPQSLPNGLGSLRFGSTVAAAAMPIAYYRAEDQYFDSLKPCIAALGFVADRFYEVRFDCGHDAKIATVLRERFGTPTQEDAQFDVWEDEHVSVSLNRTSMGFTFADRALTQGVHQLIIQKALSGGGVPAPAAPAPPAH